MVLISTPWNKCSILTAVLHTSYHVQSDHLLQYGCPLLSIIQFVIKAQVSCQSHRLLYKTNMDLGRHGNCPRHNPLNIMGCEGISQEKCLFTDRNSKIIFLWIFSANSAPAENESENSDASSDRAVILNSHVNRKWYIPYNTELDWHTL